MAFKINLVCLLAPLLVAAINAFPSNTTEPNALVFKADFSKPTLSQAFGGARIGYGEKNVILWASGGGIDVHYPKGSYSPEGPIVGGFGVWTNHPVPGESASFKFSVFFPAGFNFVHGGKLPGLYGGRSYCAGGDSATDCFSTRVMWRDDGKGELYLYANREANQHLCSDPAVYCAPTYGWSMNLGAWTFKTGEWTDIQEVLRLNTPGQKNGYLSIRVNGKEVIKYDNLVFRIAQYPNMNIAGMDVDTFFGGGNDWWATPTHQTTKFKEFILETA